MGSTAQQCRLGLFQDSDFAGDLEDSNSTSRGFLCIFGSHTFLPMSWMCKKQTSVSHSSTEAVIISPDASLRTDGIAALTLKYFIPYRTELMNSRERATGKTVGSCQTKHAHYSARNQFERFRRVLELISRFEFDFSSSRNFFLNGSNFWCVQSSTTCNETVHVPVLWPVCAHTIPFRMLWCR